VQRGDRTGAGGSPARPGLPPIPPPRGRRWLLPAVAAVVALLVGIAGTLLLLSARGDDTLGARDRAVDPAVPPPADPEPAPEPSPPPEPEPTGGPVTVEGVVLTLPPGWRLEADGAGTGCVTRAPGGCELLVLLPDVARERSDAELEDPEPDGRTGWHLGTDVPGCEAGLAESRLVVRELRPVDDKRAAYREWAVTCDGDPSRPRLWWLPETRLAFLDQTDLGDEDAREAIDEMVRGADVSAVAAP
jgi:hypothetical protein